MHRIESRLDAMSNIMGRSLLKFGVYSRKDTEHEKRRILASI
jgi:hypothetical protein